MALSNIFREPRREITEMVLGIIVVAPLVFLVLGGAAIFQAYDLPHQGGVGNYLGYVVFIILFLVIGAAAFSVIVAFLALAAQGIHAIGERVAGRLERAGFQVRPLQRF